MARGEGIDVLCPGWWADGGPILTREGVRQVFGILAEVLPEAMPSRWDVDEAYRHRLDQEGFDALVSFVDANRNCDGMYPALRVKAPAREIRLELAEDLWGTDPEDGDGAYEVPNLFIELGPKFIAKRRAADRVAEALIRIAEAMQSFYAEARWLHGVPKDPDDGDAFAPDGEASPFENGRWWGLPVRAPIAAVLGPPYRDLWPDFPGEDRGALRAAVPDQWGPEAELLPWDPPDGVTQPRDQYWATGGRPGFIDFVQLRAPRTRAAMWPFAERTFTRFTAEYWEKLGLPTETDGDPEAIRQVTDDDGEPFETWERESTDPDQRSVTVSRTDHETWRWSITIAALEFVRGDPDERVFRRRLEAAFRSVAA